MEMVDEIVKEFVVESYGNLDQLDRSGGCTRRSRSAIECLSHNSHDQGHFWFSWVSKTGTRNIRWRKSTGSQASKGAATVLKLFNSQFAESSSNSIFVCFGGVVGRGCWTGVLDFLRHGFQCSMNWFEMWQHIVISISVGAVGETEYSSARTQRCGDAALRGRNGARDGQRFRCVDEASVAFW